jgi:PAS domain S-box-containing protein
MFFPLFRGSKALVVSVASLLIAAIALADWRSDDNIPLGFLYLVPMLMLGRVLRPWQTILTGALCTLLAEFYDPFNWNIRTGVPRDTLYFAAFACIGIFVYTSNRSRQIILTQLHEIERQSSARQEAEEQLKVLIESSPAAILTTDGEGAILMANDAAQRMLSPSGSLAGRQLRQFFPALANLAQTASSGQVFRAVMQARGQRDDGETFMAEIGFSTYRTPAGARLAAMILDASEELRTREESSLHQMLAGSRIAVAAVSHEVRNVCGAIGVVHQNLARSELLQQNKDFEALGNLVLALEKIAAVDLLQYPETRTEVDLVSILDDLRIVISPALQEHDIAGEWSIAPDLPAVWADSANLMQIFLNLANNSIRALSQRKGARTVSICARVDGCRATIEFLDNGGGVAHPDELFRPFQAGAHATGLGLYLSRAFARSFGGELHYKPLPGHACFVVDLPIVPSAALLRDEQTSSQPGAFAEPQ